MQDSLSDVLSLVSATSTMSTGLVAGGAWAVRVPAFTGLKFNAVLRGEAWLAIAGSAAPLHVRAGDCFVLTSGAPFVIGSDVALAPRDAEDVFSGAAGDIAHLGSGDAFHVLGGKMTLDASDARLLLEGLPAVIHVTAQSPRAPHLAWLLQRLTDEMNGTQPGRQAMSEQLIHMLFVESMRAYLLDAPHQRGGWIGALADARIRTAMQAMHGAPAQRWTLVTLARSAGMSRSSFADKFKALVGIPPLDYLLQWRMRLACQSLRRSSDTVSAIAQAVGYASDSAFSHAFKRIHGQAPLQYRIEHGSAVTTKPAAHRTAPA